jgi:hypothetical protein
VFQKPEEYAKKLPERSNYGGKQLANAFLKDGKTIDVYFEKKHNWISDVRNRANLSHSTIRSNL